MSVPVAPSGVPDVPLAWKTSSFWVTHIAALLSLLVGLGVIGPDFAARHEQVVNAVAILAAVAAPVLFSHSRALVHKTHLEQVGALAVQTLASAAAPPAATVPLVLAPPAVAELELAADPAPDAPAVEGG